MSLAIMQRLGAIEKRGVALYRKSGDLISLQRVPTAEGPVVLGRAFAVRRLAELVKNNGVSAIQTLRKRKVDDPPVIDVRYDYEIFLERNDGHAAAAGLPCAVTADAFFAVAELLLKSGDDAVAKAEALLAPNPAAPDWEFEIKNRLGSCQQRALSLYGRVRSLNSRRNVPVSVGQEVLGRCFKAGFLLGLVKSNALSGLQALSEEVVADPPVVALDRDFREFTRRNERLATQEGLRTQATADATFMVVDLLLDTAEQAGQQAEQLLDF